MLVSVNRLMRVLGKKRYMLYKGNRGIRKAEKNRNNINAWVNDTKEHNFGDLLSTTVVESVTQLYGINITKDIGKTKYLYAIASILMGINNAAIWGS